MPDGSNPSYAVARGIIPRERVDAALRLIHNDLLSRGATSEQLSEWLWAMHWFPHLRHHEDVFALAEHLPDDWREGDVCDPQILLQFPHTGPEPEISFHLDQEPDWAEGRRYLRIVGVPLSPWRAENGGLLVRGEDGGAVPVELEPGDAVRLDPALEHSGGINRSGEIRYGIYFRWLEPAA